MKHIAGPPCEFCGKHMTGVFNTHRPKTLRAWMCEPCVGNHLPAWADPRKHEHLITKDEYERGVPLNPVWDGGVLG